LRKYDNAIFDLDGTLLNTKEGIVKSLIDMAADLRFPPIPESKYGFFIGPPIEQSLCEHYGLDDTQTKTAALVFRKFYTEQYLFEAIPYDGIINMLTLLKGKGVNLAIATYKRHDYTEKIIRHFNLDKYCSPCYGSDTESRTTKTAIIRACMADMNISASRTVYVGDTEHDRHGAEEAGIGFIGVTYGFGYTQKCHGFADTPDEIAGLILGDT
jgi:phosphoglycolate phosphatase